MQQLDLTYLQHWSNFKGEEFDREPGDQDQASLIVAPRDFNNPFRAARKLPPPTLRTKVHLNYGSTAWTVRSLNLAIIQADCVHMMEVLPTDCKIGKTTFTGCVSRHTN